MPNLIHVGVSDGHLKNGDLVMIQPSNTSESHSPVMEVMECIFVPTKPAEDGDGLGVEGRMLSTLNVQTHLKLLGGDAIVDKCFSTKTNARGGLQTRLYNGVITTPHLCGESDIEIPHAAEELNTTLYSCRGVKTTAPYAAEELFATLYSCRGTNKESVITPHATVLNEHANRAVEHAFYNRQRKGRKKNLRHKKLPRQSEAQPVQQPQPSDDFDSTLGFPGEGPGSVRAHAGPQKRFSVNATQPPNPPLPVGSPPGMDQLPPQAQLQIRQLQAAQAKRKKDTRRRSKWRGKYYRKKSYWSQEMEVKWRKRQRDGVWRKYMRDFSTPLPEWCVHRIRKQYPELAITQAREKWVQSHPKRRRT